MATKTPEGHARFVVVVKTSTLRKLKIMAAKNATNMSEMVRPILDAYANEMSIDEIVDVADSAKRKRK